ncbi:MAG: methylmalonyl-CoA mutase [Arenicella sp.]|jgi:methylmalonyl-CoA mutase
MKKLFEDFDAVSLASWTEKITADLKGKPLEVLNSNPEMDIEIKAYHHKDSNTKSSHLGISALGDWKIRRSYSKSEYNSNILSDLNEGIDAVGFTYSDNLEKQSKDILFDHIQSDIKFTDLSQTSGAKIPANAHINCDIFGRAAKRGRWPQNRGNFSAFVNEFPNNKSIWTDGSAFGNAGATTIQELAITLAQVNDYVQPMTESGHTLEEIHSKLLIELSVNENYFVNIAKMRVIRLLVAGLFKGHQENFKGDPITLYASTSVRHLAKNDTNNNLLRQTTQAMSAVLGGCDVLTIQADKSSDEEQDVINQRMAKNIQLVLKEEAYLNVVKDPSEGSYYLNALTEQILTKSWDLFKEIEKLGGFCVALETNFIQNKIEENQEYMIAQLNESEKTFLGINKHQSKLEDWKDIESVETSNEATDFKAIKPFRLESYFKNTQTV